MGRQPARAVPASVTPAEHLEREATRTRLEAKWATIDGLVDDFRRGDARLRTRRYRLRHP